MKVTRLPTAKRRKVKSPPALRSEGNVQILRVVSSLDIPPARILAGASSADLQDVVVIGYDQNGDFYFASSQADGGDVLWLLEVAKKQLLGD